MTTGVTYGGAGQPMDIDWAKYEGWGFNYGVKGHIGANCKQKNKTFHIQKVDEEAKVEEIKEDNDFKRDIPHTKVENKKEDQFTELFKKLDTMSNYMMLMEEQLQNAEGFLKSQK